MKDFDAYIRDLISQVLFTTPGERLNQPEFGVGLRQYVFEPNTQESIDALQTTVQEALNHWIGDVIEVEEVQAVMEESALRVTIGYVVRQNRQRRCDVFICYLH